MRPIAGKTYERYVLDDSEWNVDRRLVLDVTDTEVLYRTIFDEPEGTYVETTNLSNTATMKQWLLWAKLAREEQLSD